MTIPAHGIRATRFFLALVILLLLAPAARALDVVWLVRHAEKQEPWAETHSDDQPLSDEGRARAARLVDRLAGEDVAAVYGSDTLRALATGLPLVQKTGIALRADPDSKSADPEILRRFLDRLRERHPDARAVLVVGHSNTIPYYFTALGLDDACQKRLGVDHQGLIEGYDGLWRIDLRREGCAAVERQSQDGH